jgi:hypothetical protein
MIHARARTHGQFVHTRGTLPVVIRTGAQFFFHGRKVIGNQTGFLTSETKVLGCSQKENPSPDRFVGLIPFPFKPVGTHERNIMYLSDLDIVAISIALVSLMALVVTSAVANSRISRDRDSWRREAILLQRESLERN